MEPDILTRNYVSTRSSIKRSNVGGGGCFVFVLFVCFVEDVRAKLPPQSRFLVDQWRLTQLGSALSAESQENAEGLHAAVRGCERPISRNYGRWRSDIKKIKIKKVKSAIYQVCSVHLHGMQLFSFQLFTHRSDTDCTGKSQKKKEQSVSRNLRIWGVLQVQHQS